MTAQQLVARYPIISGQIQKSELTVLLQWLEQTITKNVPGDVVELGCYEGTSALFLQRMLNAHDTEKLLWLYDSFAGLPEKTPEDESPHGGLFSSGALHATESRLKRNFTKADLALPIIKKAWFWELEEKDLPSAVSFAFLDGDLYTSITESLELVWPLMSPGGVAVIDDYSNAKLPGAKRAVDEFVAAHNLAVRHEKSLAILKKV